MMKIGIIIILSAIACTSRAQDLTAELNTLTGKSGLEEKMIIIKKGGKILDSLSILAIERDISFTIANNTFYYLHKSNSDIETAQSTFYLSEYAIVDGKLKLFKQKWIHKSFVDAEKFRIFLDNSNINVHYTGDCILKYSRNLMSFKVEDFETLDKAINVLVKVK